MHINTVHWHTQALSLLNVEMWSSLEDHHLNSTLTLGSNPDVRQWIEIKAKANWKTCLTKTSRLAMFKLGDPHSPKSGYSCDLNRRAMFFRTSLTLMEAQSIKEDLNLKLFNIPFTWTLQTTFLWLAANPDKLAAFPRSYASSPSRENALINTFVCDRHNYAVVQCVL